MTQKPSEREIALARQYAHSVGPMDFGSTEAIRIFALALARYRVEVLEKERAAIIAILDSKRFYLGGGEGELADAIRERNEP